MFYLRLAIIASIVVFTSWNQMVSAQTFVNHSESSWTAPYTLPLTPAAGANLPDGRVLLWSAARKDDDSNGGSNLSFKTSTSIFDPALMTASDKLIENTGHDMFCPGTAQLSDGRLMVTGGSNAGATSIFDPATNKWSRSEPMNIARGYHSMTTLSDGSVFTLGGSWSGDVGGKDGEIWREGEGWQVLSDVIADSMLTDDPEGVYRSDNHIWLFEAPNGRVFQAGPSRTMHWIDVEGDGSVSVAGERGDDNDAMNGNALMYDVGKILTLGGSLTYALRTDATNRSYRIDITGEEARVTRSGDMSYVRAIHNSAVLPNGEVVVVGGITRASLFSDFGAVMPAEIWNPETDSWTELAPMQNPRVYHSFALLLKDGRVMAAGGGLCGDCTVNHPDVEILTPPYLLNADGTPATRPEFTGHIIDRAMHGSSITVTMDSTQEHDFALVKTSAATHSINNDQRRIPLIVNAKQSNVFEVLIPANAAVVPPGNYFLFAMNSSGVPSIAETIRIQSVFGDVALNDWHGRYVSAKADGSVDSMSTAIGENEVFTLSEEGDKVSLLSSHGTYVSAIPDGSVQATVNMSGELEQFDLSSMRGNRYSFYSDNGTFLSSENDGRVLAFRTSARGWETFILKDPDPVQRVTVLGSAGNYLATDFDGGAIATRDEAFKDGIWTLEKIGTDEVALKSGSGYYMAAFPDGTLEVNSTTLRGWERFKLIRNDDGTISLQSFHGLFLRVLEDDTVRADAQLLQAQAKLRPSFITGE